MPLKIKTFDTSHVAVLNNWADQQENTQQAHTRQLAQLQTQIETLKKQIPK